VLGIKPEPMRSPVNLSRQRVLVAPGQLITL
jgi:hypothetical protein